MKEWEKWEMTVDLKKKLVFPDVVQTTLRPDIVIWSDIDKRLVMVELTVPWETRCEEAYERKLSKYTELLEQCREKGWRTWLFPVEVGARGSPTQSMLKMPSAMGVSGHERKRAVGRLVHATERASNWLWYKREEKSWKPATDT